MDDPDFKAYIFPRKSKSTQRGGSIILIKSEYTSYLSVVESSYDTIIFGVFNSGTKILIFWEWTVHTI